METIKLHARYGYIHTLTHVNGNLWQFNADPKAPGYYRIIGEPNHIEAFDPEGGPFLCVGGKIENKTIKSISSGGIFELE